MLCKIYILVYLTRLFAAHWSLWIPHIAVDGQERKVGDRVHATGDRLNGFVYEYDRDYNIENDDRKPIPIPIALISAKHLSADDKIQTGCSGSLPFNNLDAACQKLPAPGPSLNKVALGDKDSKVAQRPAKHEVKDCQWWIEKVVPYLVSDGLLLPLDGQDDAATIVAKVKELPRH